MKNHIEEDRYLRAKKRVEKLKGFYWHFASYFVVNMFISVTKIISDMDDTTSFMDAFLDFGTFAVWIFWGIGVFFHALGVFAPNLPFLKRWEEDKLEQFIKEDQQQKNQWE